MQVLNFILKWSRSHEVPQVWGVLWAGGLLLGCQKLQSADTEGSLVWIALKLLHAGFMFADWFCGIREGAALLMVVLRHLCV